MQTNPFAAVLLEIQGTQARLQARGSEPATKGDLANVAQKLHDAIMVCYKTLDPQARERFVREILEGHRPKTTRSAP